MKRKRRSKAEMEADAEKVVDEYIDATCRFGILRIGTALIKNSNRGGEK